ncbi:MAG: DUF4388 domain-containing protein [Deltaproteobacteria bacterium]|nr:DUF4388 domain-containing protein [Deltaproteobacteria bacterium]
MAATAVRPGTSSSNPSGQDGRDRLAALSELEGDLAQLRRYVDVFAENPTEPGPRDRCSVLFRRLAAAAAARDWALLGGDLSRAEALVKGAGVLGVLDELDRAQIDTTLDRFADGLQADQDRDRTPSSGPVHASPAFDATRRHTQVLSVPAAVVGSRTIADVLRARGAAEGDGYAFAIRHLGRVDTAHAQLRTVEPRPDVVVVDADEPGAVQLVEDLLGDARTETIPIVVVGTWTSPEQAARFVALGVSRCLAKPLASGELRRACALVAPGEVATRTDPLGALNLDELGKRLASELHHSLCDAAVDDRTRRKTVDLGEGSAILTVMWDAVARVRELVSAQTAGEIRFQPTRRDEALPAGLALSRPAMRDADERAPGRTRGTEPESLAGLVVLVAEEDLTTNWFLTGVLRDAGATVLDAFSGDEALARASEELPDAVLAGLGLAAGPGRSLVRALREDALLRDVPVVLVGADPAQLRRAEDLGEACEGTLLKGAPAEQVAMRLLEATRARRSLAARIAEQPGTVQGRLDGLAPATVLQLAARARPDCRVSLHGGDAVLEVDLRGGRPVRACRTATDGSLQHGMAALTALLSLGSGRFQIEPSEQPLLREIEGTLAEALSKPSSSIRKWQAAVSGAEVLRIDRVELDGDAVRGLLAVTPEPARAVLSALLDGRSPRALVHGGEATLDLVERVLVDLARRLAIVHLDRGTDAAARPASPGTVRAPAGAPPAVAAVAPAGKPSPVVGTVAPAGKPLSAEPPPIAARLEPAVRFIPKAPPLPRTPSPLPVRAGYRADEAVAPFSPDSFEVAPAEEPRWAAPVARVPATSAAAAHFDEAVFEPDDDEDELSVESLARRSVGMRASAHPGSSPPSPPPARSRLSRGAHTPLLVSRVAPTSEVARLSGEVVSLPRAELSVPPPPPVPSLIPSPLVPVAAPSPFAAVVAPSNPPAAVRPSEPPASDGAVARAIKPSAFAPRAVVGTEPPKSATRFLAPVLFAVVGVALAVGARWWRYQDHQAAVLAPPAPAAAEPAALRDAAEPKLGAPPPSPSATAAVTEAPPADALVAAPPLGDEAPPAPTADEASAEAPKEEPPQEVALSAKERKRLPPEHGILEVVAGRKDEIVIDGKRAGMGPIQRVSLPAGEERHEVRIRLRGEERVRYVTVKPGVKLRLRMAPPWSR